TCRELNGRGFISRIPFNELLLALWIDPWPARWGAINSAPPWFGCEPGAKTFLRFAKLPVERIGAESFEDIGSYRSVSLNEALCRQQAQASARAIDAPIPLWMRPRPILDFF